MLPDAPLCLLAGNRSRLNSTEGVDSPISADETWVEYYRDCIKPLNVAAEQKVAKILYLQCEELYPLLSNSDFSN